MCEGVSLKRVMTFIPYVKNGTPIRMCAGGKGYKVLFYIMLKYVDVGI